jgi:hypothetical protein
MPDAGRRIARSDRKKANHPSLRLNRQHYRTGSIIEPSALQHYRTGSIKESARMTRMKRTDSTDSE